MTNEIPAILHYSQVDILSYILTKNCNVTVQYNTIIKYKYLFSQILINADMISFAINNARNLKLNEF